MKSKLKQLVILLACGALATTAVTGCGGEGEQGAQGQQGEQGEQGEDGEDGKTSLVETEEVGPGDECEAGGIVVYSGVDEDGDGELSQDEIAHTEYVCAPPGGEAGGCDETFAIDGVTGTDQRFYYGAESESLAIDANYDEDISLAFIGDGANFDADSTGQFTATPNELGGPFDFVLIAASTCGSAVANFTIEDVEEAITTIRLVHLFEGAGDVDVSLAGEEDALASLGFTEAAGPLMVDPGEYEFDLWADEEVVATTPEYDFEIGQAYTVVAHVNDEALDFLILHDDVRSEVDEDMAMVRAIHAADGIDAANLLDGEENILFEDLEFGLPSDATMISDEVADLILATEEDIFFEGSESLFEDGHNSNIFVFLQHGSPRILVQRLDTSFSSYSLLFPPPTIELFEDFDSGDFPADFTTGGDADWFITDDHSSTGGYSLQAGDITHNQLTWVEVDITFDGPAVLRFDWMPRSENNWDGLAFCVDEPGCSYDNDIGEAFASGPVFGSTDYIWETVEFQVGEAGTHTFRWVYEKDGSASTHEDTGWIDNIEILTF